MERKHYKFSSRSLNNLKGVDKRLQDILYKALETTEIDFTITEGLRTLARQKELYKKGASKTLKSYHLTGKAVDLYPYPIPKNLSNPGQEYLNKQKKLAQHIKKTAEEMGYKLTWGGDWKNFKDTPHFQIER